MEGLGEPGSCAGPATYTQKPEQIGEVHVVSDAPGWPWTRAGTASSLPGPASLWAREASGTRPFACEETRPRGSEGQVLARALLAFRALPTQGFPSAPLCPRPRVPDSQEPGAR